MNRICQLFDIKYPIICGGMQWLSRAELVAAVSNAGGLGLISATSFASKEDLVEEINKTKALTTQPFGVNISMLPGKSQAELTEAFFQAVIENNVPVVETSGRSPEEYVETLHSHGVKLIHKVPAVRFAQKAQRVGADAVAVVGFECGGHPGLDDVTTMALIPRAADSLSVPLIAGGGIADARGFVAALALGADGVVMGTRFLLSEECSIHETFRQALLAAKETDTKMTQYSIRNPMRAYHNEAVDRVLEMERNGAGLTELLTITNGKNGRRCWMEGDTQHGVHALGQCVGQINEILPAGQIIQNIMQEAKDLLPALSQRLF